MHSCPSDWCLSESYKGSIKCPYESARTSRHYRFEKFEGCTRLGRHYTLVSQGNFLQSRYHAFPTFWIFFPQISTNQHHDSSLTTISDYLQITGIHFRALSQIRICRLSQKWPYLHGRWPLCWTEWKINYPIFPFYIFRVMVDCIFKLLACHLNFQVCHRPKKSCSKSGQIYRKDVHCSETEF